MYYCEICKKSCSGIENFREHEASEKHKKKVKMFQQSGEIGNASLQNSMLYFNNQTTIPCELCSKRFSNLSDYQQHTMSEEHALAVLKNAKSGEKSVFSSAASSSMLCDSSKPLPYSEMKVESITPVEFQNTYYARCEPCDKSFSGPEPYEDHIVSARHKKKCGIDSSQPVAEARNMGSNLFHQTVTMQPIMDKKVDSSSKFSALRCDDCNMTFTGPVPHEQHLKGETHSKSVRRNTLIGQTNLNKPMDTTDSGVISKSITMPSPFYCDVCNISCSGPDNIKQHYVSKKHMKAVAILDSEAKRREILKNFPLQPRDSREGSPDVKFVSSTVPNGSDASAVKDMGQFLKNSLFAEDSSLNSVDPSTLNLTVFKIGESIDFDTKLNSIDKCDLEKIIREDDREEYYDTYDELMTED